MTSVSKPSVLTRWFRREIAPIPFLDVLPIHVEQLIASKTHAERAEWLLMCPQAVLLHNASEIRWALRKAKFQLGTAYLEVELSALHSVRQANGRLRLGTQGSVQQMRRDLFVIAEGRTP